MRQSRGLQYIIFGSNEFKFSPKKKELTLQNIFPCHSQSKTNTPTQRLNKVPKTVLKIYKGQDPTKYTGSNFHHRFWKPILKVKVLLLKKRKKIPQPNSKKLKKEKAILETELNYPM